MTFEEWNTFLFNLKPVLSVRACNALLRAREEEIPWRAANDPSFLLNLTDTNYLRVRNLGRKSFKDVKITLHANKLWHGDIPKDELESKIRIYQLFVCHVEHYANQVSPNIDYLLNALKDLKEHVGPNDGLSQRASFYLRKNYLSFNPVYEVCVTQSIGQSAEQQEASSYPIV